MDTESTNSLDVSITHLEELSESVNDRLSRIETRFDEGVAETRTELRAFRSNLVILVCGLVVLLHVLAIPGIVGK